MRTIHWAFGAFLVFGTIACSDRDGAPDGDPGTPDGSVGTPDGDLPDGDLPDRVSTSDADGGFCCPIDPTPGCCMRYGGSPRSGVCSWVCDGMPWPSDPRWEKRTDQNGCLYWAEPPRDPARGLCGAFPREAGTDANGDSPVDAPDVVPPIDVQDDSDASLCCPIDPTPGCCMQYGGSRRSWGCARACDGMAWPKDPRWEKRNDENGCPYWVDPPYDPAYGVCGQPPREAGIDAPMDTQSD